MKLGVRIVKTFWPMFGLAGRLPKGTRERNMKHGKALSFVDWRTLSRDALLDDAHAPRDICIWLVTGQVS